MLEMKYKDFVEGREATVYGDETECKLVLDDVFAAARKEYGLKAKIAAIKESGEGEVEVETYHPSPESNLLPEDYLTHDESDPRDDR